jgi:MerR family transcriptional regulator/heat shock protein HspR
MTASSGPTGRHPNDEPRYVLHVAARLVGLPPQRLRRLERLGLLDGDPAYPRQRPVRPLFSEADLEQVRLIHRLIDDLGVNLAGAEVILHMRRRMFGLRAELDALRRDRTSR